MTLSFNLKKELPLSSLLIGVLEAQSIEVAPSSDIFLTEIDEFCKKLQANPPNFPPNNGIRKLLKFGKFRATGRSKPANEYLLQSVVERRNFPNINNIVDINNFVSLYSLMPASVFDLEKCNGPMTIRHGTEGEEYVFNNSNHTIQLKDLLLVADSGEAKSRPIGNPVKDRMETKVFENSKNIFAVLYAHKDFCNSEKMNQSLSLFSHLLTKYAKAKKIETMVIS
jgi:DNA/RNA-binding domain of Phe-tRNA-synthetase-like protein